MTAVELVPVLIEFLPLGLLSWIPVIFTTVLWLITVSLVLLFIITSAIIGIYSNYKYANRMSNGKWWFRMITQLVVPGMGIPFAIDNFIKYSLLNK